MTQFHEGQDVEVWGANMYPWRKAKIIRRYEPARPGHEDYRIQFSDGVRAVIDAAHIRAAVGGGSGETA